MSSDQMADEVRALRTEVQALTQGLLTQQETLRIMDEKLNCILEAAVGEADQGESPLQALLIELLATVHQIVEGQGEIIKLLHAPVH
ncbi:MAG TPA: hypothetical protein VMU82_04515 [Acetobacteraceae bacterium]|nr:hypothetical protein [Acetobacteraceae bacterium]